MSRLAAVRRIEGNMAMSNELLELLNTLEDLLVKEFRASQALFNLTRDERSALAGNDVQVLLTLVEHKEALLDEMAQLDDSRRMITQKIQSHLGLDNATPSLQDIISSLDTETGKRLGNLRSGILTLLAKIRELTHGNRALATTALERTDAVQSFLLSLIQPPTASYRPQGMPKMGETSLAWEVDHIA
jgi:flagellar biosynthesis/type III secretory pathway chaperone